ncbi:DUF3300 domain-containing protein [bacterium]|nr:DUF3300 domain-containing protein [bacterium]
MVNRLRNTILLLAFIVSFIIPLQARADSSTLSAVERDLAPIALYPDSLLGNVLIASTYPEQITEAYNWSQENPEYTDQQAKNIVIEKSWDKSVASLLVTPDVLAKMALDMDWTYRLGDIFTNKNSEMYDAIQSLRHKAKNYGVLKTNSDVVISEEDNYIYINPANPQAIVVPQYDAAAIYRDRNIVNVYNNYEAPRNDVGDTIVNAVITWGTYTLLNEIFYGSSWDWYGRRFWWGPGYGYYRYWNNGWYPWSYYRTYRDYHHDYRPLPPPPRDYHHYRPTIRHYNYHNRHDYGGSRDRERIHKPYIHRRPVYHDGDRSSHHHNNYNMNFNVHNHYHSNGNPYYNSNHNRGDRHNLDRNHHSHNDTTYRNPNSDTHRQTHYDRGTGSGFHIQGHNGRGGSNGGYVRNVDSNFNNNHNHGGPSYQRPSHQGSSFTNSDNNSSSHHRPSSDNSSYQRHSHQGSSFTNSGNSNSSYHRPSSDNGSYQRPSNHGSSFTNSGNSNSSYHRPSSDNGSYQRPSNHGSSFTNSGNSNSSYHRPSSDNGSYQRHSHHGSSFSNSGNSNSSYHRPSSDNGSYQRPSHHGSSFGNSSNSNSSYHRPSSGSGSYHGAPRNSHGSSTRSRENSQDSNRAERGHSHGRRR